MSISILDTNSHRIQLGIPMYVQELGHCRAESYGPLGGPKVSRGGGRQDWLLQTQSTRLVLDIVSARNGIGTCFPR